MGSKRKVSALRQALRDSEDANAQLQKQVRELQVHTWEMQMISACMLDKLTDKGALVLTIQERRRALEGEWGIENTVLPDAAKPMIVRVVRNEKAPAAVPAGEKE